MITAALTRERGWNDDLAGYLPDGTSCLEIPATETLYVADDDVRLALSRTGDPTRFRWLIVTSARAARAVAAVHGQLVPTIRTAVVGQATARAVRAVGCGVDVVGESGALSLADALTDGPVLWLGAAAPHDELTPVLAQRGVTLTHVAVYATRARTLAEDERAALRSCDVVVVGAPSAWDAVRDDVAPSAIIVVPGATTEEAVGDSSRVVVGWDATTAARVTDALARRA